MFFLLKKKTKPKQKLNALVPEKRHQQQIYTKVLKLFAFQRMIIKILPNNSPPFST